MSLDSLGFFLNRKTIPLTAVRRKRMSLHSVFRIFWLPTPNRLPLLSCVNDYEANSSERLVLHYLLPS